MKKYLLPVSAALGVIFDLLFWKKSPGVSFPLFIVLGLAAGYFLLRLEGSFPKKVNYFLLIPMLFFSILTILRREPLTVFLGYLFTLFSVILLIIAYLNGLWPSFGLADYVVNFFNMVGGMLTLPWQEGKAASSPETGKAKKSLAPILRGLALSLPIWLVFIAMLSSADLIFAQRLNALLKNFNLENLSETFVRLLLVALVGFFFSGGVLYAARRSAKSKLVDANQSLPSPFLGMTESSIVLGGVILLFGAFVLLQFRYFFSGQANITLDGFTYAEYARRGFGELLAVAVLSILLQKGLSQATRRETAQNRKIFMALSLGLVALVLAILASAFQRLTLYETAYGFTRLRTYPHVFMIWLAILLVAIALMEVLGRQRLFINAVLLAAMGFGATLGILNIDKFIVQRNLERADAGMLLDVGYLTTLSTDAIPMLAQNLTNNDLPVVIHDGIVAVLICYRNGTDFSTLSKKSWPSFHFSDAAAERALRSASAELEGYRINNSTWPSVVTSPNGREYVCSDLLGMD